ncbi:MAG TPA: hypothetical protein VMZ50_03270 [Phycisphaerae bacterium]|nr:hypothetical protein [Phycisphaerae bacterium]
MAKKRSPAALFEVIAQGKERRGEGNVRLPAWVGPKAEPAAPPPLPGAESAPGPAGPKLPQPAPRMVSTAANRLTLSLNYATCAVVAVGLLVLLAAAFWVGRATAPPGTAQAAGLGGPGNAGKQQPPDNTKTTLPPSNWVPGKYYLIIQQLKGLTPQDRTDADKIVDFCETNGVYADVAQRGSHFIVLSYEPYESGQSTEGWQYARKVEELGRKYMTDGGGRYNFGQRRNGKLDPWFIRFPPAPG